MVATLTKPRDVQVLPIAPETTIVRSRSWNRLRFEIEYALERGTTANSFVISADQEAIIDPPGESFTAVYLDALKQRFNLDRVRYVILGHVNPNRAVTLKAMLELMPTITFVCSNPGAIALRSAIPDQPLDILVMRGSPDEVLDLGRGHRLQFIPTPMPRYPDSLCTYDSKTGILYTDKLYGAHTCSDQVFDEGWTLLREDRRYYYDSLMAPHARQVATAIEKLADYPAHFYAPGHGPLVRYGLSEQRQNYQQWSQAQRAQEQTVASTLR